MGLIITSIKEKTDFCHLLKPENAVL